MVDWVGKVFDVTVSSYAENVIKFEKIPFRENHSMLAKVFEDYIGTNYGSSTVENDQEFKKFSCEIEEMGMWVEVYANKSKTKKLLHRRMLGEIQNMKYLNFKTDKLYTEMSVNPGEYHMLLFGRNAIGDEL